jgi:hypothetical protein
MLLDDAPGVSVDRGSVKRPSLTDNAIGERDPYKNH